MSDSNKNDDKDPEEGDALLKKQVKVVQGGDDAPEEEHLASFFEEAWDTITLGVPIFVASLSWIGMKTTDSALLGHVSAKALAASSLSDLWTMCSGVLIQGRVLGILVGAAVGADNPTLAGIYLQVSYLVLSSIAIFVMIAWWLTGTVWTVFGSDPAVARDAGYYATVLSLSIPAIIAFSQLSQFFSAQRILYPEVQTASMAMLLNLTLGLIFVLGIPIPNFSGYGFNACPIVTTIVVYFQFAFMYLMYVRYQGLHKPCWAGWSWPDMTVTRIKTFSALYFPSAFGMASDYWRVAVIGGMAASFGEVDVAVFNTSYRIMWIVMVLTGALTGAAGIRMSIRLGQMKPQGAKQAGTTAIQLSVMILAVLGVVIVRHIRFFGRIFTEDEEFLRLLEECRVPFAITLVLMNLAIAIEKIPYSMGRTTAVFYSGVIASWGAQVPAVYVATTYWRHDLVGLYWGMAIGYFVLCLLYGYIAVTSDWRKYALLAQERSEAHS